MDSIGSIFEAQSQTERAGQRAESLDSVGEAGVKDTAHAFETYSAGWQALEPLGERPSPVGGSLVLTNRQVALFGMVGVAALGLSSVMAYSAGRLASGEQSRVLVVEPAEAKPVVSKTTTDRPAGATAEPPKTTASVTSAAVPIAVAKASPVPPLSSSQGVSPVAFWQVGSLDRGMAEVSKKYLEQQNLPVKLEAAEGTSQVRVLVGPAGNNAAINNLKQKLDALGFSAFLKKY